MYPKAITKLIEDFKSLPGVGEKTAERFVMHLATRNAQELQDFSEHLEAIVTGVRECSVCHFITDSDKCYICCDSNREESVLCVVESVRDVIVLEKLKSFKGRYHILGGAISPMNGVGIEDINIKSLIERVKASPQITEIIIATNPTFDGEATADYISKLLANTGIVVSRIAHGLPVGSDLEYADELTLFKAIEGRKKL